MRDADSYQPCEMYELAITRVIYMLGEPQDTIESWYKYNTSGNNRYRHDRGTMRVEVQVTGRADVEGARDMGKSTRAQYLD